MSTFKKREKFNLEAKIRELKLDPRVRDVLESTRPLTNASLIKVSKNIESVLENMEDVKDRSGIMEPGFWFACGLGFGALLVDNWSAAVINGASQLVLTGRYTEQNAYGALCLAAGSCLRAPAAEPFRLVLSLVTKAGLRPPEHDESPRINVPVETIPKRWQDLSDTYASLEEVKGSQVVQCLAIGLGSGLLEGKYSRKEASRMFKSDYAWRASSPIPQLLRGETRC